MKTQIEYKRRKLSDEEVSTLVTEIQNAPHITYVRPFMFKLRKDGIIATENGKLCGVCSFYDLGGGWVKLGPLFVLEKYRSHGIGSTLLSKAINLTKDKNIYVGSSRDSLKKLNQELGFNEIKPLQLPFRVILFFTFYLIVSVTSIKFWRETIRKAKIYSKRKYKHFVREGSSN